MLPCACTCTCRDRDFQNLSKGVITRCEQRFGWVLEAVGVEMRFSGPNRQNTRQHTSFRTGGDRFPDKSKTLTHHLGQKLGQVVTFPDNSNTHTSFGT